MLLGMIPWSMPVQFAGSRAKIPRVFTEQTWLKLAFSAPCRTSRRWRPSRQPNSNGNNSPSFIKNWGCRSIQERRLRRTPEYPRRRFYRKIRT